MALGAILAGASLLIEAGGAVLGHQEAQDRADATREAAMRALRLKRRDLSIRALEETQAANQRILQGRRQAQQLRGTAQASAASAGVAGRSAQAIVNDIARGEAEFIQSVQNNLVVTLDQIQRLREAAAAEAEARINQTPEPSLLGTALRIGAAGLRFGDFLYRNFHVPGSEAPNG